MCLLSLSHSTDKGTALVLIFPSLVKLSLLIQRHGVFVISLSHSTDKGTALVLIFPSLMKPTLLIKRQGVFVISLSLTLQTRELLLC